MRSGPRLFALACGAGPAIEERPPVGATAQIDHPVAIVERTPIWANAI